MRIFDPSNPEYTWEKFLSQFSRRGIPTSVLRDLWTIHYNMWINDLEIEIQYLNDQIRRALAARDSCRGNGD